MNNRILNYKIGNPFYKVKYQCLKIANYLLYLYLTIINWIYVVKCALRSKAKYWVKTLLNNMFIKCRKFIAFDMLIFYRGGQMISTTVIKIINILPDRLIKYTSKKVVDQYLNKYANISIEGDKNLKGIITPTIFICNHLSNSDGLVLDKALKEIDPTFVAGIKLSNNAVTSIGINVVKTTNIKPNSVDKNGLKKVINLVKEGESVLIFPEGTRSRVGSLIEAKRGPLLIARMTGAPIVPLGLYGTEKLLPVNTEGDMSTETFNYADVHINIGKQFELPKKTIGQNKKDYEDFVMEYMMKKIARLLPEDYRGVYK